MNAISPAAPYPRVSVVIPTCNRPEDVRRCLDHMARVSYPHWDLVVVDQSDDERTEAVARRFMDALPNLTYHRMREKGAARARNGGIAITEGEIIAFIDDDCTVAPNWLDEVAATLQRHPQVSLIFGAVESAPHNPRESYVTVYTPRKESVAHGPRSFLHTQGLSANMYMRREVVARVGLFDTCLGPGSGVFTGGGEDIDYLYRSLARGLHVVYTPHVAVKHYGMRDYGSGAVGRLFRNYAYCSGAADMKLLRCGHVAAIVMIAVHALYCLTRINLPNLISRRGMSNLEWISMYTRGLFASFRLGVDRRHSLYVR